MMMSPFGLIAVDGADLCRVEEALLVFSTPPHLPKAIRVLADLDHRLRCLGPRLAENPGAPDVADDDPENSHRGNGDEHPQQAGK